MTSPFRYRPAPSADVDGDGEIPDWEDNALSNALAWASVTFTPTWCQSSDDQARQDWASRFSNYLWTSCPCCMILRGVVLGFILAALPLSCVILLLLL